MKQNNTTTKPIKANNMTLKEKAQELYNKFYSAIPRVDDDGQHEHASAKQCALIAVDEILEVARDAYHEEVLGIHMIYWNKVKQEIEKL